MRLELDIVKENYNKLKKAFQDAEPFAHALMKHNEDLKSERDAANLRADVNHRAFEQAKEASKSKDLIIAGLNQKVVTANARAEQAERDNVALRKRKKKNSSKSRSKQSQRKKGTA